MMQRVLQFSPALPFVVALTLACSATAPSPADDAPPLQNAPVFEDDVLPIFTRYCFNCHGKSSPQLGLDLRSARHVRRGSQNGPVVEPGSLEDSLLWKKVSSREMPPALFKLKLSNAEIAIVRRWIETGARSNAPEKLPADVQQQFDRFEEEIRPILDRRCVSCHGGEEPEADLDLRTLPSLVRGSRSGPVVVEGFSEKSVLIRKVTSGDMPPPETNERLTTAEINVITAWIDKGRFVDFVDIEPRRAQSVDLRKSSTITDEDRQFWAFQKPVAVSPPTVKASGRVRTPIDRFVLSKLEAGGLTFSADASKRTLLRRAYFDLVGLPPTPAEAREFFDDDRPDAYEHLIDRLLASPRYGERWGRHWLDVVGYVDTTGKDFNPTGVTLAEGYWRYRDYVVRATNQDKPWNRFLIEQIAGDELVDWRAAKKYTPEILELLTATGFLRNVLDATDEDISNLPFDRYEALFKLMERVSSSTMGMTLACARCHSHKFDPIPQEEYYRFLSLFTAAYNPSDWLPPKRRFLFHVSKAEQAEIEKQKSQSTATLNALKKERDTIRGDCRNRLLDEKLKSVPEEIRAQVITAITIETKKRSEAQKKLAAQFQEQVKVTDADVDGSLSNSEQARLTELHARIVDTEKLLATLRLDKVQALWDVGKAPTIRLLHRGDVDFAGPKVSPGFLSVLSPPDQGDAAPSPNAVGQTTGLRLAFAEWLTNPDHPVTARVIVNRFWQQHFGRGIVESSDNFGATGSPPSHPELLDWLAVEFMRQGWSGKQFHRLIMTSTVYRQSSKKREKSKNGSLTDSNNRLLGRMSLRRLDAESLRDSVIHVSGQMRDVIGGPPVMLKPTSSGLQTIPSNDRRSVYLLARRSNPATFMRVFDYPVIDVNCTRRSSSATPLQSLTMINSEFLTSSASRLARQVETLAGAEASPEKKIEAAYALAFTRPPKPTELASAFEYLRQIQRLYRESGTSEKDAAGRSLDNFVHMLLCSNEFLYVD